VLNVGFKEKSIKNDSPSFAPEQKYLGEKGLTIISLNWSNTILVLGIIMIMVGLVCEALWLRISQKPYVLQVPERYIVAANRVDERRILK